MDLYKDSQLPNHLIAKYEGEADRFWDLFYRRNEEKFFKDRHWFANEFPQLLAARKVLEVGCGAGNSVYPLLELNPSVQVLCCDFAPSAVELVRRHPQYQQHAASGRLRAFVADIVSGDDLAASVAPASVDVCTMIFVLSAVPPHAMRAALRNVGRTLRPGGQLLFRDYAEGDLAQGRLAGKGRQQRLEEGSYVRWDGTLAAYFTEAGVRQLFESEGFRCDSCHPVGKLMENRRTGEQLDRRFVQAVFTRAASQPASAEAGGSGRADEAGAGDASGVGNGSGSCHEQVPPGGEYGSPGQQARQQQQWQDEVEEVQLALGSTMLRFRCRQQAPAASRAAAEALAAVVLACPWLSHGGDVLELCSWDAPLASLSALRYCRRAVAAGWDAPAVERLRGNARSNGHQFVIERLRLTPLAWREGDSWLEGAGGQQQQDGEQQAKQEEGQKQRYSPLLVEQLQRVQQVCPAGFQTVLAAVPATASRADLRQLLSCAAALLSRQPRSRILLCTGAADIDRVRQVAGEEQLRETGFPADLRAAVQGAVGGGGNQPPCFLLLSPACR